MQAGSVQDANASDGTWFFVESGRPVGPMPLPTLLGMAGTGRVGAQTLVWSVGMAEWVPAGTLESFRPFLASAPPTVPGPMMRPLAAPEATDAATRMLLPVGRSPYAIVAGYLGLFSVLLVPAPLAVLFAVLAIRDIRSKPETHGMGRAIFGLVMGILGSLALIAMIIGSVMS